MGASYFLSHRNVMSPGMITSTIWLFCFILFYLVPNKLHPSEMVLTGIGAWVLLFTLGALLAQSFRYPTREWAMSPLVREIYFWLSIATIPLLLLFVYQALHTGEGGWAMRLRTAAIDGVHGEGAYTPFYYILWQISYLLYLVDINKKIWRRAVILGGMLLLFGLCTMSKTLMLNFAVMTMFVLYDKKYIRTPHIAIGFAILLVAMLGLQAIRQSKDFSEKETNHALNQYVLRGIIALDKVKPESSEHWGENTFRLFYAVRYKLGMSDIEPVNPILPWIYKPVCTNTYTVLYPFYKDFGSRGIPLAALLAGLLFGFLFRKYEEGHLFWKIIYAYLCVILVTQYNGEAFLTNLAGHIKMVITLSIPFILARPKKIE